MSARIRLFLSVVALIGVVLIGAVGYMFIEADRPVDFLDAVYMTAITVSTVGYKEVWPLSRSGQLWTIGVIAFGVATVSYSLTSLVALVVGGELRSQRERIKMEKGIQNLRDHVIICGFGRMARLTLKELIKRDVHVVVVEAERNKVADLREAGATYVIGDATEESTLLQAGLTRAKSLVVTLPSDADNVYVTLTAHTLCPRLEVVARADQPSAEVKLLRAGASRVVCPSVIGATKIANILTRPTVVDFVEVAVKGVDLEMDEYVLAEDSALVGKTLRTSRLRRNTGAIVVGIKRAGGEALVNPDPDAVLECNDTLILVGPSGISSRLDAIESGE